MMPRARHRPRRRAPLRAAALPLLLVAAAAALALLVAAAAALALLVRPAAAVVPLDPHIPHEQALLDAGFAGAPGPDQPDAPVAVDRVLIDGAATYVQYHMSVPVGTPTYPMPALPILADGRGVPVLVWGGDRFSTGDVSSAAGWTLPVALPAWVPWHPTTVRRFYAVLPPLPARARAATLQFCLNVGQRGCSPVETILVPLDPRAAGLSRRAHPGMTTHAAGVTLALRDLGVTHLTYTYTYAPHGGPSYRVASRYQVPTEDLFAPLHDALRDAAGRAVPAIARPTICATGAHVLRCATTLVFPPQPPGARLTLAIRAVQLNPFGFPKTRSGPMIVPRPTRGLWRLPVVIP